MQQFYATLSGNNIDRPACDIGFDWERLCQKIAKTYYENALSNHEGIRLANNTIPDIVVGAIQRNEQGKITHVDRIIECKKSLYFEEFGNVLNNETTFKYYEFCDIIEYWILDKESYSAVNIDIFNFPKLKCVFADDLLESSWLSTDFKDAICILKKESSQRILNSSRELVTSNDLCHAIDYLIQFPPPPQPAKQAKNKKKSPMCPTTVIRQYTLNGELLKEFESVSCAAAEVGLKVNAITKVTSGQRNSAGGFLWKKCEIGSPTKDIIPPNTALDLTNKIILQVDKSGEVIATYDTIGQAVKASGINRRSISDALKGIQKTAGGFLWLLDDVK